MNLLTLFWAFFQIGAFSFGGGYASLPLIQSIIVEQYHWLSMAEYTDVITISQMTPGPIAINAATFVGQRIGGFPGMVCATLGCILPSVIVVSILALIYQKYKQVSWMKKILDVLHPVTVGLIVAAAASILMLALFEEVTGDFSVMALVLMAAGFGAIRYLKWDPILVMCLCALVQMAAALV